MALLDAAVGLLLVAGAIVLLWVGRMLVGGLLAVAAVAWFIPDVAPGAGVLLHAHRGLLAAAALALVPGRRALVAGVLAFAASVVPAVQTRQGPTLVWALSVVAAGIVVGLPLPQRVRPVAWLPVLAVAGTVGGAAVLTLALGSPGHDVTVLAYLLGTGASAAAVVAAALWLRPHPARVADAIVEVTAVGGSASRLVLAEALRDAQVDVAIASDGGWVDDVGRPRGPVAVPPGHERVPVRLSGDLVAELSVREDLARTPAVAESVAAAARLLAEQQHLRAGLRAEAASLEDSRRRLVVVDGEERAALAARLSRLTAETAAEVRAALGDLPGDAHPGLEAARRTAERRLEALEGEIARLAAGLGPTAIVDGGLAPALAALVEPLDVAVDLRVDLGPDPLDPGLATTAYLVCSEAVANAVKHAAPGRLTVTCRRAAGGLEVVVADDGRGGAAIRPGGGLAGLRDRVAAFGGTLSVHSDDARGTEVRVLVPLGDPARQAAPIRVQGCP